MMIWSDVFELWLFVSIVTALTANTGDATKYATERPGLIGCLFSGSLCRSSEECFDDHLFGTCQLRDTLPDDYVYSLSHDQLRHLSSTLQRLVTDGYTWRDPYTQCVLAQSLFSYRHESKHNRGKPICTTAADDAGKFVKPALHGVDSRFEGQTTDINVSRNVISHKLNRDSRLEQEKSYEEFIRFMQDLSPDDLFALKQYLLEETLGTGFSVEILKKFKVPPLPTDNNRKTVDEQSQTEAESPFPADNNQSRSADQPSTPPVATNADRPAGDVVDGEVSLQGSPAGPRLRYRVIVYVLFGLIAIFIVVCLITCYQFYRTYRGSTSPWTGVNDDEFATDEYKDLCRQHMYSRMAEKDRPSWSDADSTGRMSPAPSLTSIQATLKEEPVKLGVDISAGTAILSCMEEYMQDGGKIQREWDELGTAADEFDLGSFARAAFDPANAHKNRCTDILPYEKFRVLLNKENNASSSSYINATYIMDDDPRRALYIVTQGPLASTVDDFWQMVWEQGTVVIVNLTCLAEGSVVLCQRYWPDSGRELYHIYEVTLLSEHESCDNYVVRNFSVQNTQNGKVRDITQFHFLSWPAERPSVPESATALLEFRRRVNKCFRGSSPIVVHCSDGVSRTGTYCLIDIVLNRLANKGVKQIDIAATLEHLRDQRFNMVDTKEQYEFAITAIAREVHSMLVPTAQLE